MSDPIALPTLFTTDSAPRTKHSATADTVFFVTASTANAAVAL